jgi:hypothetical protein
MDNETNGRSSDASIDDPEGWYIGPEIPGREPVPDEGFRTKNGQIKRCVRIVFMGHW